MRLYDILKVKSVMVSCVCCGTFRPRAEHEWLWGSADGTLFVRKMMTL